MKKQTKYLLSILFALFLVLPTIQSNAAELNSTLSDGEYEISFEVLKDTADEISATGMYMQSPAKVIVENGKSYAIVTLNSSEWWQSLKVQTSQPGNFEDTNFVEAEVLSEDEAENTRVVQFEVLDLSQILNAKIHIIVTGVPGIGSYDHNYDIRLKFNTDEIAETPVAPEAETEVIEETAIGQESNIDDGDYAIEFAALHEKEDKASSMSRYIQAPASLTVKDGKNTIEFVLTNNEQITAFKIEEEGTYVDADVVSVDEEANIRTVAFEVSDFSTLLNANVEVHVAAQNYTGNHIIRLSFDEESIQPKASVENTKVFEDIQTSWAKEYIESLAARGMIQGVTEDTFRPDDHITRAQFTVILARALDLPKQSYEGIFTDITAEMDWAAQEIEAANRAEIVFGTNGSFYPNDSISRQQMVTMIIRAIENKKASVLEDVESTLTFTDEAAIQDYAKEYVELAVGLDIVGGQEVDGGILFAPDENATRAQAAKMIYHLLEAIE